MGGEKNKAKVPVQTPAPAPLEGRKRNPFSFIAPLFSRAFNGKHPAQPVEEKPRQGLGLAKHERKNLSAYLGSVDIALDSYDDIFSDFDPSPFERRALSGDFIKELMRRYSETRHGKIEVVFSLPRAARNRDIEALIKTGLREHFEWQLDELWADINEDRRTGGLYIGVGAVVIALSTLLTMYAQEQAILKILGEIILVPGWLGEFMGLEKILESKARRKKQCEFLEQFRDALYVFVSNEDVLEKMVAARAKAPQKDQKDSGVPAPLPATDPDTPTPAAAVPDSPPSQPAS